MKLNKFLQFAFLFLAVFLFFYSHSPASGFPGLCAHPEYIFRAIEPPQGIFHFLKQAFIGEFGGKFYRPVSEWLFYIPFQYFIPDEIVWFNYYSIGMAGITLISAIPLLIEITPSRRAMLISLIAMATMRAGTSQLEDFTASNTFLADSSGMIGVFLFLKGLRKNNSNYLYSSIFFCSFSLLSKENLLLLPVFLLFVLIWKRSMNKNISRTAVISYLLISAVSLIPAFSRLLWLFSESDSASSGSLLFYPLGPWFLLCHYLSPFHQALTVYLPFPAGSFSDSDTMILLSILLAVAFIWRRNLHSLVLPLLWSIISISPYMLASHTEWPSISGLGPAVLIGCILFPFESKSTASTLNTALDNGIENSFKSNNSSIVKLIENVIFCSIIVIAVYAALLQRAGTFSMASERADFAVKYHRIYSRAVELRSDERMLENLTVHISENLKDSWYSQNSIKLYNIPAILKIALKNPLLNVDISVSPLEEFDADDNQDHLRF